MAVNRQLVSLTIILTGSQTPVQYQAAAGDGEEMYLLIYFNQKESGLIPLLFQSGNVSKEQLIQSLLKFNDPSNIARYYPPTGLWHRKV